MSGFSHAHVDELPAAAESTVAGATWRPVRHHFGIRAFGCNAWTAPKAGGEVIERHDELPGEGSAEPAHEELYVVLAGRARFVVDGEEIDAPAGTLVHVNDPALLREATAAEPSTTVLAIGAAPGVPFEVSAWEARRLA